MERKNIKIILVGSRYTGKGQIGRAWGKTNADLPTLQPVILYERIITHFGNLHRVVAWVLSFDPEFEKLRCSFYKNPNPDGIIFTFDVNDSSEQTVKDMDKFKDEILEKIDDLPPAILFGMRLTKARDKSEKTIQLAQDWGKNIDIDDYFEGTYEDTSKFENSVEKAFIKLLDKILVDKKIE